jgi:asparagine synthase (glutamine-hydrolysing)
MISTDHRYLLSFNREIYKFHELCTALEAVGYWFRNKTDSESEVVLHALAH